MSSLRPREIPVDLSRRPVAISYSDGEGAGAGVGIGLWMPGARPIAGYIAVPEHVRRLWSRATPEDPEHYDIFEVEAIGPALILANWGDRLRDHLWIHFIDNESAQATLVKGSSSVCSGDLLAAYTHLHISRLGIWSWFDRVDSKANPVDQLSRGVMTGDWDLLDILFPPDLLSAIATFLDSRSY
jgi:hypothetical protein